MTDHRVRELHMPEALPGPMAHIADGFARIAACVADRKPTATLTAALQETEALCRQAAATMRGEKAVVLTNVQQAIATWRQVWPRLGTQPDFRLAVAREAALWAKRLQAMAKEQPGHAPRA